MIFESGHIYHIYNQGNNHQQIFFTEDNYLFFLKKIREYIKPFADILAWCLMPNHFHLMILLNREEVSLSRGGVKYSRDFAESEPPAGKNETPVVKTFNAAIGIMLRSYTAAINNQLDRSGSLFRKRTKAVCITKVNGVSPAWYKEMGITKINVMIPEAQYPNVCFDYIHNNPVKAGLVKRPEEWEYSSYKDYKNLRNGRLINREKIKEYIV